MMSTSVAPAPQQSRPFGDGILLRPVSWDYYERTIDELDGSRIRVNYHRGVMEMMNVSNEHEAVKHTIARLIDLYGLESNIPVTGLGSVTCRREDVEAGVEPDECYYVQTNPPPPDPHPLDLAVHAPPDLAIEVEITRSALPRVPIFGSLGVPEVWRFDGQGVRVLRRQPDATYQPAESSLVFPDLPIDVFNQFLMQALRRTPHAQHGAAVAFRDWLRDRHA